MATPASVQRIYLTLLLGNTLAASLIWGINTIFLLDAGLSNLEAFAANAFFTAGMVIFEVPTGIVADTIGRRVSYLLGTLTLAATTLAYVLLWQVEAAFWLWAIVSVGLGLGFTFFSGAVEAWLVDALTATGFTGSLETVFGHGQVVTGAAMLVGSVAGGYIAQATSLGVPFVLRGVILVVMFVLAFVVMKDVGFTPGERDGMARGVRRICGRLARVRLARTGGEVGDARGAVHGGRRHLRLLRAAAVPARALRRRGGVRDRRAGRGDRGRGADRRRPGGAVDPPGVRAAHVGAARSSTRRARRRSLLIGLIEHFVAALALIFVWGLMFAAASPIRQAFLNGLIPSQQRATILSFDSMLGSSGGVVVQPVLGRSADVWGYPGSYLLGGAITALALPFVWLSRRQNAPADQAVGTPETLERAEVAAEH